MNGMNRARLGDVCKIKYGKDHKRLEDGKIPVYGSGGIMRYVNRALYDKKSVLIPRKGSLNNLYFVETPFWSVDTLFYTEIDETITTPEFLYYQLRTLDLAGMNVGTAVPSLTTAVLNEVEVVLLPLSEQTEIGNILRALDYKIANNTAINHHLEQMAQAIFKSWFVDFEPWGGVQPTNWTIGTISDTASDIVCGKTPSTKFGEYFGDVIPFITIPDMHGIVYVTSTERSLSEAGAKSQSSKTVPPNSVCVSCIATAGLVALTSVPSQTNQQINTVVCVDGISPYFVYLTMVGMSGHIKMLGSSGSATNNLNKGQFSKIKLVIPESDVMNKFAFFVEPLFEAIKLNQQENAHLAKIRDTLLPCLMSGELSVADFGDAK